MMILESYLLPPLLENIRLHALDICTSNFGYTVSLGENFWDQIYLNLESIFHYRTSKDRQMNQPIVFITHSSDINYQEQCVNIWRSQERSY